MDNFKLDLVGVPDEASKSDLEYVDALVGKLEEYVNVFYRKHHDYGPGNIAAFGALGVLVRLNDKVERLKNLMKRKTSPKNESVRDTVLDILGYAAIMLMVLDGDWDELDPS